MMFAIGSFVGFEATAIYSEEAKNPKRTVPVATYVAIIVIGVLYAVSSWAVVLASAASGRSCRNQDTAGLTFSAAAQYLPPAAADAMAIMLVTSLFATLLAFHSAISRYLFALARRGIRARPIGIRPRETRFAAHGFAAAKWSAVVLVGIFAWSVRIRCFNCSPGWPASRLSRSSRSWC